MVKAITVAAIILLVAACGSGEPLSAEETEFCSLFDQLDLFGEREPEDFTPAEFEDLQRESQRLFLEAIDVAPEDLAGAVSFVAGSVASANDAYESIGFDLARIEEIDPERASDFVLNYPQEKVNNASNAIDKWTGRNC